jgi:DNA-binding NtrC family response regulator
MSTNNESTKSTGTEEVQTRRRVRCTSCELVQWATRPNCRRCGVQLPQPVINMVEVENPAPVVQKEILEVPVIREITVPIDRPCLRCALNQTKPSSAHSEFPTIEQMERSLVEAALDRCQGDGLKAAAMLGIGKTTISRKLKGGIQASLCVLQCDP